jgi:hypothetical protein
MQAVQVPEFAEWTQEYQEELDRRSVNGDLNPPDFGDCRAASPKCFTA